MYEGLCIRCGESPVADDRGYCGHCHWAVAAEVALGFQQFDVFLTKHAEYAAWAAERGVTP